MASPRSRNEATAASVSAIPEAFLDTIVINGGSVSEGSVPPKRVRFRMLNGSQARFYHLNLYAEDRPIRRGQGRNAGAGDVPGRYGGRIPASGSGPRQQNSDPAVILAMTRAIRLMPDGPFNLLLAPPSAPTSSSISTVWRLVRASFSIAMRRRHSPGRFAERLLHRHAPTRLRLAGRLRPTRVTEPNTRTLLKITVAAGSGDTSARPPGLAELNTQLRTTSSLEPARVAVQQWRPIRRRISVLWEFPTGC